VSALHHDPDWPRASAWLGGDHAANTIGKLAVLGAPVKLGSITPGRCDLAPQAIRSALARYTPYDVEAARDLREIEARDLGDLNVENLTPADAFEIIRDAARNALAGAGGLILLGGDNSITRPGCHACATLDRLGLLTLDAHFDLRNLDNGLTNGNPIRALLADGLPGSNIVQIGIQSFANSKIYADVARDAGITVVTADQARSHGLENVIAGALAVLAKLADAIYVDLDLDALDRAYAPATPGSRPGGFAPWELRRAARVCGLHPKVRVMDMVEIDPTNDIVDMTSVAAAACLLSFASGLHQRLQG
jgi:formiminoglutamase